MHVGVYMHAVRHVHAFYHAYLVAPPLCALLACALWDVLCNLSPLVAKLRLQGKQRGTWYRLYT